MQPIDRQSNGPQVLFGVRYHTHLAKSDEVENYHNQIGYCLWAPFIKTIIHTLTIPRGQTEHGRPEPFHHTDRYTLTRVAPPTPNPLTLEAREAKPEEA